MTKPKIENMTLREKIGQTLLVRQSDLMLRADKDYKEARRPEEAAEIMEKCQFGGVWVHGNVDVTGGMKDNLCKSFHFTTEKQKAWLGGVKAAAKIPLLCASDAAANEAFSDLSVIGRGLNVGAANSDELSYALGRAVAREHALAGCNWLWTPVVDLVNPRRAGIVRPFAGDADVLIKCSKAFIKGMQSVNVAGCVKHFPGHDSVEFRDSHIVATKVRDSVEEWEKRQGRVFKEVIDSGVESVMSAVGIFLDAQKGRSEDECLPTALCKEVITDILKGKWGFDGVVITDDVTMGGFTSFYGHDDLYPEFLKAGNDILLGVGIDAVDIVERAVKDGRLSQQRIDDACRRVLAMKEKLGLYDEKEPDYSLEEAKAETAEVLKAISEKSVTLIRDRMGIVPVSKEKIKRVTIIAYSHAPILSNLEAMKKEFELRGAEVTLRDKLESFTDIETVAQNSDLIVYAGYIGFHKPKGAPSFYDDVFWSLRYVCTCGKEKSVGVSLGFPFIHYDFMDAVPAFANLYVTSDEAQRAFVAGLYGEIEFKGVAPLNLNCVPQTM